MTLSKYRLGDLIEISEEKNVDESYGISDVKGISIEKKFIETKANMDGVSLKPYLIVKPNDFCYVTVTSRNGDKISLAYNSSNDTYIVSSSYIVFRVKKTNILDSVYLFMYFNRSEFDRYSRFNSWGSARETFDWDTLCDIEIELPSLKIQQKYVSVYKAMVANQKVYEKGLDDLKLVCDAYIENLPNREKIGNYIQEIQRKNEGGKVIVEKGVSISKQFIDTKSAASNIETQKVVCVGEFAFNSNTSRNGESISIALNNDEPYIVSNTYVVCKPDETVLLPEYLLLWFCRNEFDRYARFNSWGSARETISIKEIQEYKIAIPPLNIQKAIADIHHVYLVKKSINEKLKNQIKNICPILIQGAIKECKQEA